jgi:hypothetical protein
MPVTNTFDNPSPMLDANSPAFQQQYPNGAIVYDRTGRRISGVVAFNPETGEVISVVGMDGSLTSDTEGMLPVVVGEVRKRRRFHPAPLTIKPRQWLHIGFDNE